MIPNFLYNNKVLSAQEKENLCNYMDKTINELSESIDGMYQLLKEEFKSDTEFNKIQREQTQVSIFLSITLADCIVLSKLFIKASNLYEKNMLRGKLKVLLNEGFKNLYGFTEKGRSSSYWYKIEGLKDNFPGYKGRITSITNDLEKISKMNSWWKEERCAEVHIDAMKLCELRYRKINENKEIIETLYLVDCITKINQLLRDMGQSLIDYMIKNLSPEDSVLIGI